MQAALYQVSRGIPDEQMCALHGLSVDDGVVNNAQLAARREVDIQADPRRHDLGAVDHRGTTVAIAQ